MTAKNYGVFTFKSREEFFFAQCGKLVVERGLVVIHHLDDKLRVTFVAYATESTGAVYVPRDCRVKAIDPAKFHFHECDPIGTSEAALLRARTRNLSMRERLIFELKLLYVLKGGDGLTTVSLQISRATLAESVGCSRNMVGREMKLLEKETSRPPIEYSGGLTLYINAGVTRL